jgi:ribosomal protein S18 acetylase RimI-like enzyme
VKTQAALSFAWLTERTGYQPAGDARGIEAVDDVGEVRGMVVFDHWTPAAAQVHVALESMSAARALLFEAFGYLFKQHGRSVAIGITPAENTRAMRLNRHLGFRVHHLIRDGWAPGQDLAVLELRRENCRFLRGDA